MQYSIDGVFKKTGDFGPQQKVYVWLLSIVHGWCAFHQLLVVFIGRLYLIIFVIFYITFLYIIQYE